MTDIESIIIATKSLSSDFVKQRKGQVEVLLAFVSILEARIISVYFLD